MIPYNLWPQRIAIEMGGDFFLVRRLIEQFNISWVQTLEGIFETLDNHEMLHEPVPEFARLAPYKDETYLDYAWRIRNSFFNLPIHIRGSEIVRGIAIKNIRTYMPTAWSHLCENQRKMSTSELIDRTVRQAKNISHCAVESKIFKTPPESMILQQNPISYYRHDFEPSSTNNGSISKKSSLSIVDPTIDDQMIASTTEDAYLERSLHCYSSSSKLSPKGQKVTIKGILFNENSRVNTLIRTAGNHLRNGKSKQGRKVYFVASDDEKVDASPADRIDRDDDIDWEMDQLENEMNEDADD
ncbi:hypothetical protein K3495_g14679 [Podosphaera aphanis]|nr:hypothetical protein K3495_g14679 [Podosphaera aphanis]